MFGPPRGEALPAWRGRVQCLRRPNAHVCRRRLPSAATWDRLGLQRAAACWTVPRAGDPRAADMVAAEPGDQGPGPGSSLSTRPPAAWPGASHPASLSLRSLSNGEIAGLAPCDCQNSITRPTSSGHCAWRKGALGNGGGGTRPRTGAEAAGPSVPVSGGEGLGQARSGRTRRGLSQAEAFLLNGASICFRGTRGYPPTLCPHVFDSKGGWRGRGATGIAKAPHTAESRLAWAPRPCRPQGRPPPARGPARPRASAEHRAKPRHRAA